MFLIQMSTGQWIVSLDWTGRLDDICYMSKADAEKRMQELRGL